MELNSYQLAAAATAIYPRDQRLSGLVYAALGLAGEAGEVANKVKKVLRDDHSVLTDDRKAELCGELGDVLWYIAAAASELGVSMEDLAVANLSKLSARQTAGTLGGAGDAR